MTQTQILHWLKSGAFCRAFGSQHGLPGSPENHQEPGYFIYLGPFQKVSSEHGSQSLIYQEFFSRPQVLTGTSNEPPIYLPKNELLAALEKFESTQPSQSILRTDFVDPDPVVYASIFSKIQMHIEDEIVEKMVPVTFSKTEKRPDLQDRCKWIRSLINCPDSLIPYGFWQQDFGVMGATPEILFYRSQGELTSFAVAGTLPKENKNNAAALVIDKKERHEHQLVVDDIRERLQFFGPVCIEDTEVKEFPTLYHLVTPLKVRVQNSRITDWELLAKLHPTSALGVYPRRAGLQLLLALPEQKWRGLHGSPLVFKDGKGSSLAIVAIRSVQWASFGTLICAGGGVVKESELDREWQEINHKLKTIYLSLGLSANTTSTL